LIVNAPARVEIAQDLPSSVLADPAGVDGMLRRSVVIIRLARRRQLSIRELPSNVSADELTDSSTARTSAALLNPGETVIARELRRSLADCFL
jgi:hypothetical protein